jgi:hypothetical protein
MKTVFSGNSRARGGVGFGGIEKIIERPSA